MNAVELQQAIKKISVLGSVLYVAAHPDDENTALLAYLAQGKLYRTAYLSVTRGEGGQNLIGSEQGAELGIIRTQELLAARRIDGAEQFFTRAIDFGYSKSSEEAIRLWNKDSVVKDMVWVIRNFRPDIIITRFSPTLGGHGQHLASAILAEEAFRAAGDSTKYSDQLRYVKPWKPKRLLFNHFRFGNENSNKENAPSIKIDVGEYNPLLGKSFTEIAGISRTMHKSQAMGSPQNRGSNVNEFVVTSGEPAKNDLFEGIDLGWQRIGSGKKIEKMIASIHKNFDLEKPEKNIPALVQLYHELNSIKNESWVEIKKKEVQNIIQSCAGLFIDVTAPEYSISQTVEANVTVSLLNRSNSKIEVTKIAIPQSNKDTILNLVLQNNQPQSLILRAIIAYPERNQNWIVENQQRYLYNIDDQFHVGLSQSSPPITARIILRIEKESFIIDAPVRYKWIDPIDGELYRNVYGENNISLSLQDKNILFTNDSTNKSIRVTVKSNASNCAGIVSLKLQNSRGENQAQSFSLSKRNDDTVLTFIVKPPKQTTTDKYMVTATTSEKEFYGSNKIIQHSHIPPQVIHIPSEGKLVRIDLQKKGKSIGYIAGAGDEIPTTLEQMGYSVQLISDDELQSSTLLTYDAIVAGVRAYNTRTQLRAMQNTLMKYVEQGGTYIVQYQTPQKGETENIGPYPFSISRDRVTDETATLNFVHPNHVLLATPNKISANDFDGWIQERGLSFADKWDARYETVLSCSDPNEKALEGGLLVAHFGKGYFIYTGYAFFRQLPAGVGGAFRLFANLLSIGK